MDSVQPIRRFSAGNLRPLAIVLIAPAVVAASAAVLIMLLGIFVLWLAIVGVLIASIVIADLARRSARRLASTPAGALNRQAIGIPGR
jgi:membrane protein implicated in regulation of membrane protease activity